MATAAHCWRAEIGLAKAWPALEETQVGDWIARFAAGVSRRANSLNPLSLNSQLDPSVLAEAQDFYAARRAQLVIRIPSFVSTGEDDYLAALGFTEEGHTRTLRGPLSARFSVAGAELARAPGQEWLTAAQAVSRRSDAQQFAYAAVLSKLDVPTAFALAKVDGQIVATAYAALAGRSVCLESVATDEAFRNRGYGRRVVEALLAWARDAGADEALLQMVADNEGARAFYAKLGIDEDIYGYHYRRAPC